VRLPRDTRRKTVRFSQEQLAERLNVASSTVARVKPEHDT
jgi:transcriptional regulator with XRE-family HTH domain